LLLLSVVLVGGAAALVLWSPPPAIRAAPLRDGDAEIVWLDSATNESSWERFVTAVDKAGKQLQARYPDLQVEIGDNAFPMHTTTHPELAITVRGKSRLVFRWYKLTSDQKTEQWVAALLDGSRRPPLAILGGSSSDQAKEIALALKGEVERRQLTTAPLLLLTSATADRVDVPGAYDVPLNELHGGRTFRFCFTNQQMAAAVANFVTARDELRPDAGPFYVAQWEDDAYSKDLTGRFCALLQQPGRAELLPDPILGSIEFSVGGFDQPNRWEARVADWLMQQKVERFPGQKRPLLVLAAPSSQPARRLLRGLEQTAPFESRRFVIVTGDALGFSTVYRDREVAWPVQDLPFDLVFFCHRNPVDEAAGFPREDAQTGLTPPATGTDDLLLNMDIVEALVHAARQDEAMPADGDELGARLRQARWRDGRVAFGDEGAPLFDGDGNRRDGTGEHVVWLHPDVKGQRVLPHSSINVFDRQGPAGGGAWRLVRCLDLDYGDPTGGAAKADEP
jgi:hypothetical protein